MNLDELAKHLCDIAWSNGYVLTYKLEKIRHIPEHVCGASDFAYIDDVICPGCEWNKKTGHCNQHAGYKSDCDECYYARFE